MLTRIRRNVDIPGENARPEKTEARRRAGFCFGAANMMGRPSSYTREIADAILDRLAAGESLRAICADDEMPGQTTVYRWLSERADFREQYARAREDQAETFASQIIDIADDESVPADSRRIRVDARKWVAGKLRPKVYGDKAAVEHSGPDGGPVEMSLSVEFLGSR